MKMADKHELNFTDATIQEIGDDIVENVLDHLADFIDSGVRNGLLPKHIASDIANFIAQPDEASFTKLEIDFLKARGQLHKRVREYVYKTLPIAIGRHGEEYYGQDAESTNYDHKSKDPTFIKEGDR